MKSQIKAVRRNLKRYRNSKFFRAKFIYTKYYDTLPIDEGTILFQCYSGSGISCNPFYILKALCQSKKYDYLRKVVASNEQNLDYVREFLNEHGMENVEVVELHSREYCKILASAKYLVNNVTFPFYFIKKDGQKYLNTWHGTPLKALGKAMKEDMHAFGNVQRNFLMSDYILAPNQFTLDVIRNDYMLNQFFNGSYILNGYPRNNIFLDIDFQNHLREKLELIEKKVVVYMPTWRGTHALRGNKEQFYYIMYTLIELDKRLNDDTVVYVKEHNMSSLQIDFSQFEHVKEFPKEYETYEFLSIADCLITDYSSVMFDFANTNRKIILYAYDESEYLKERGMYIDFSTLPFEKVYNTLDLAESINDLNCHNNYEKAINEYIKYDGNNVNQELIELLIDDKHSNSLNVIDGTQFKNNKKNVLIFTGALLRNGITTALKGLLNNVDTEKMNYILTFNKGAVQRNKDVISELGEFDYISIQGQKNQLFKEAISSFLYFRFNLNFKWIQHNLESLYKREAKRIYPNINFDYIIHYTGYERKLMNLFKVMDGEKFIYVHSNLIKENKMRNNVHLPSLKSAYRDYDKIVVIREGMEKELLSGNMDDLKGKIYLAHNFNNYEQIIENSKNPISFNENTECNIEITELEKILEDKNSKKFINVARFSVEKGLDNLIRAFEQYYTSNPNDYLIIIGSHGQMYNEILELVENSIAKEHIVIILSMNNPFPVLVRSDVFVLSSHYEGLPMVIMEALILNKPVISTNITGPKEFLEQGYGYLVDDSVEGLVLGMQKYKDTGLNWLTKFDYLDFNRKALSEFENLFK